MSRVADALRRHRSLTFGASAKPEEAAPAGADAESWYTTEVPWELSETAETGTQVTTAVPRLPADPEEAPVLTGVTPRGRRELGYASHEQLTRLVQRMLQDGLPGTRVRSVLFTSIGAERSAGFCAATAEALARQTPGSVCLVDANLRALPERTTTGGLSGVPGLSDLLLQKATLRGCLARLTPNLWQLPAGTVCADAAPIVSGEQTRAHLRDVLGMFDYVLVDTPTASLHGDAIALAALFDGVVLVIGANATRREVARRTIDQIREAHAKILGAVLTNRDFPIPETLYRLL